MPIDPNIAMGYKPIQIESPLNQFAQVSQLQNFQNQNALIQRQLEKENMLNELYQQAYNPETQGIDYNKLTQLAASGGIGSAIPQIQKSASEVTKTKYESAKLFNEVVVERLKLSREGLATVTTPEQFLEQINSHHDDPILEEWLSSKGISREKSISDAIKAMQQPGGFERLLTASKVGVEKALEQQYVNQNLGNIERVLSLPKYGTGAARVVQGSAASIGLSPAQSAQIANERTRIGLEAERVNLAKTAQERAFNPEFQQMMAESKVKGELIAKDKIQAQLALPKVINNATDILANIDLMIGKQEIRDKSGRIIQEESPSHPGFASAVGMGFGARFIPGTDAAGFQALYDQVMGQTASEVYESVLKGAGSITKSEQEFATKARNRMALAQNEKEFIKAADDYRTIIMRGIEQAKKRVDQSEQIKFLGFE